MTEQLLVLGEALIDVVTRGNDVSEHVGGSALNTASGLARLGEPTTLAGWWAPDRHGRMIEEALTTAGVRMAAGSDQSSSTPVAHATLDADGKASYRFDIDWQVPAISDLDGYQHLHTGSLGAYLEPGASQIVDVMREARAGATLSYDPNVRPAVMGSPERALPRVLQLVQLADVVKLSDEDLLWLYPDSTVEDVLWRWSKLGGPALFVCTRGDAGAYAMLSKDAQVISVDPIRTQVVDTVGAGDSFMAGLLSGLLEARLLGSSSARDRLHDATAADVMPALQLATKTSAITVGHAGAYAPDKAEVAALQS